jgi:hypothetical protein
METGFHTQAQPRVRETRMHSHVTHVIRSRLAILPARIASCCRVGMDQLAGWGAWGRSLACLDLAELARSGWA